MNKILLVACFIMSSLLAGAQELFVFTEPASNMPAHTLTPRFTANLSPSKSEWSQRYTTELMLGISKKLMLHAGTSFSNMYTGSTRWEAVYLYGKYRFLSHDELHRHFRMAAFTEGSYSRNKYHFDEVSLQGERRGIQAGIIATQLLNRFALSGSLSHTQAFDASRKNEAQSSGRTYQSINYTLSGGLLVLPRVYTSFKQLNFNIYTELLGQQTLDRKSYFIDLAPSIQFLFNSNSKLNLGYRFQLKGNQNRGMERSILVSFEHSFFNVL